MAKNQAKASLAELKKVLPLMKHFNTIAGQFTKMMNRKITQKEKRIQVLVSDISLPDANPHSIRITTLDIGDTEFKKQGRFTEHRVMDWEKGLGQNKGFVI